jgi:hypothetical protein
VVRTDYDGPVTLLARDLPSGVTAAEVVIAPEEARGQLQFVATAGATPGATGVRIRAEGELVEPSERILQLTIRPTGTFLLSANPMSLVPGGSASTTIDVTRVGGFAGVVDLVAGAPPGLSATVDPSSLQGVAASALLSVSADRTLRAGAYFVTVRGSSPGLPDETIDVTVVVVGTAGRSLLGSRGR